MPLVTGRPLEPKTTAQRSGGFVVFGHVSPLVNHNGPLLELLHTGQIPIEPKHANADKARRIDL